MTNSATLDIDLGNTRLKFRCGDQRGAVEFPAAAPDSPESFLPGLEGVRRVRVSSVRSAADNEQLAALVQRRWACRCEFALSTDYLARVHNGYDNPEQLGVDRWLALVAGYNKANPPDKDSAVGVLVADLGTAATLDYVDPQGQHLGGFIVPGVETMQRSLLRDTAAIRFDAASDARVLQPGRQTRDAVERGVLLALVRLIDAELERFDELCHHNSRLLLCGGGAQSVAEYLAADHSLHPDLVLDGLVLAMP